MEARSPQRAARRKMHSSEFERSRVKVIPDSTVMKKCCHSMTFEPGADLVSRHAAVSGLQPARRAARRISSKSRQPDLLDQLGDRDVLFAMLSSVLPWTQAAGSTAALLERYGSLTDALVASEQELATVGQIGASAAGLLKAAHAAAIRLIAAPLKQGTIIKKWNDLEDYLTATMAREPVEQFRTLFLDARNRLIADEVLAQGGPRGVMPDHRLLVRRAVQLHATALIIVHNHPAGDPLPSTDDIEETHAIRTALNSVGVTVHDHLIVARGGITSLRRLGFMGN